MRQKREDRSNQALNLKQILSIESDVISITKMKHTKTDKNQRNSERGNAKKDKIKHSTDRKSNQKCRKIKPVIQQSNKEEKSND